MSLRAIVRLHFEIRRVLPHTPRRAAHHRGALALPAAPRPAPGQTPTPRGSAVALEGGVPILSGGKLVGTIGASGGTGQQDGQVAKAGADAIK
jgi:uncharacterized protein GlcG (DUF336 family)